MNLMCKKSKFNSKKCGVDFTFKARVAFKKATQDYVK